MDIGVFIPIGNNGWLISATSPQYMPSFELNKTITQKAEGYGFDFALSMIKLRGFGGKTEFWEHNLESFTLMAGLAAVTKKIKIFATAAATTPAPIVARMAPPSIPSPGAVRHQPDHRLAEAETTRWACGRARATTRTATTTWPVRDGAEGVDGDRRFQLQGHTSRWRIAGSARSRRRG